MLNKFIGFLVMFFLFISGGTRVDTPVFSATSYDSGSSSEIPPTLIFTEWQVGRGVRGYSRDEPLHHFLLTICCAFCRM